MAAILVIQYSCIQAWAAVILNSLAVIRALSFYFAKSKPQRITLGSVISALNIVAIVITILYFDDPKYWYMSIVIGVAQVVGTIAMATASIDVIKISQLAIVSPCWLAYSIFYTSIGHNNVGGIVQETFNIISIIVYYAYTKKRLIERDKLKENKE